MANISSINGNPIVIDATDEDVFALAVQDNRIILPASSFENGSLNLGEDDTYLAAARARSKHITSLDYDVQIRSLGGKHFNVSYYDDSDAYTGQSGWKQGAYRETISAGTKFRMLLSDGASNSSARTVSQLRSNISVYRTSEDAEHGGIIFHRGASDSHSYKGFNHAYSSMLRYEHDVLVSAESGVYLVKTYDASQTVLTNTGWLTTERTLVPAGVDFTIDVTPSTSSDDYYDMSDMLDGLRVEAAGSLNRVNVEGIRFLNGNIDAVGADESYHDNNRMRSDIAYTSDPLEVSMASGGLMVFFFDADGTFRSKTNWVYYDSSYVIPANTYFRLLISTDLTGSGYVDPSVTMAALSVKKKSVGGTGDSFSLSPNIIFQSRNVDSTLIPPESKWSVRAAAENQYDRVRFTVRKTTDGYYFNCHDDVINYVAKNLDGSDISSSVAANGHTLAELNQYDWGIKYGAQYAGATVPLLEETLKFAALFNLGVTWHAATSLVETDADIEAQIALLDKYGLTDNLIVITATGNNLAVMQKFIEHNPRVCPYIGAADAFYTEANIEAINALQTPHNKIYAQQMPWGTPTSDSFLEMAKENGWLLYNSIVMNQSDLLNVDTFSRGYSLMEVQDVYSIKSTIRSWASGLVDV